MKFPQHLAGAVNALVIARAEMEAYDIQSSGHLINSIPCLVLHTYYSFACHSWAECA